MLYDGRSRSRSACTSSSVIVTVVSAAAPLTPTTVRNATTVTKKSVIGTFRANSVVIGAAQSPSSSAISAVPKSRYCGRVKTVKALSAWSRK